MCVYLSSASDNSNTSRKRVRKIKGRCHDGQSNNYIQVRVLYEFWPCKHSRQIFIHIHDQLTQVSSNEPYLYFVTSLWLDKWETNTREQSYLVRSPAPHTRRYVDKNGTKEPDEVPTKAIATLAKMVASTSYHIEVVDRYWSSSDNLHGWGKGTRAIRKG